MAVLAMATVAATPMVAQQQERERERQERAELERRMRELQNELRDIQRRLGEARREERVSVRTPRAEVRVGPRSVFFTNRARLGVTVRTERSAARDSIGAELMSITPGGPAEEAGLRSGDIITTFNGERLVGRYPAAGDHESEPGMKLVHFAQELEDGDSVRVEYRRGTERRQATIVARELERESGFSYGLMPERMRIEAPMLDMARSLTWIGGGWFDLELVSLNAELGEYFGTTEGLLVIRAPRDSSLNLRGGDVILRIDGRTPSSHSQLMRIFRSYSAGESVQIEIMRQRRRMTVTATIPDRGEDDDFRWDYRQ